jgi:hypothetical protein
MTVPWLLRSLIVLASCAACTPTADAWQVSRSRDEMRDGQRVSACLRSANTVRQDFPYNQGATYAILCLINLADGGYNASIRVNQGQIDCLFDGHLGIRVEESPSRQERCVGAKGHSPEIGFFDDDNVVHELAAAKNLIRIQVTLYNFGDAVFRFDVKGKRLPSELQPE